MRRAGDELSRAIGVNFLNFGGYRLESLRSTDWASATFAGQRHELAFRLEGSSAGAAADAFLDGLEAREFELRDHIVADIALVSDERHDDGSVRLEIEALTVEAA